MPIGPQPHGRRGTVEEPYTPLNLRLVLAAFGFVVCTVLAVLLFRAGWRLPGWLLVAWAVVALVDIVVIQLRRRARKRTEDGRDHSMFE
jgi:membrane protein implicated in regulation of membrane protease activity